MLPQPSPWRPGRRAVALQRLGVRLRACAADHAERSTHFRWMLKSSLSVYCEIHGQAREAALCLALSWGGSPTWPGIVWGWAQGEGQHRGWGLVLASALEPPEPPVSASAPGVSASARAKVGRT